MFLCIRVLVMIVVVVVGCWIVAFAPLLMRNHVLLVPLLMRERRTCLLPFRQ